MTPVVPCGPWGMTLEQMGWDHGIPEWFGSEGTFEGHPVQPPARCRVTLSVASTSAPKSSSIHSSPSLGFSLPRPTWSLHVAALDFTRFAPARLSSLSGSLWMASHASHAPHGSAASANLCPCRPRRRQAAPVPRTDPPRNAARHCSPLGRRAVDRGLFECDHPADSLSTERSTRQIHVSPIQGQGCRAGHHRMLRTGPGR